MHQGLEAEVFTPANLKEEKLSAEAGGAWFSFIKLFKRKESEVKVEEKKMRQQIKCRGCQVCMLHVHQHSLEEKLNFLF